MTSAQPEKPLASTLFVVIAEGGSDKRKLFSVQWEQQGGKLGHFVHLPYFADSHGLLGKRELTVAPGMSESINLAEDGLTTTQRLKYTHHPDDESHFSQDSRALTTVRVKTLPLRDHPRHLFTVNFWDIARFEQPRARDARSPTVQRTSLYLPISGSSRLTDRVAGRIFAHKIPMAGLSISASIGSGVDFARPVRWRTENDGEMEGLVLMPPSSLPQDFFITLAYVPWSGENWDGVASMVFIGGFHSTPDAMTNSTSPADGFIAMYYRDRTDEWSDLVQTLGTIDYSASPK